MMNYVQKEKNDNSVVQLCLYTSEIG